MYRFVMNIERVFLTSPKALAEVLVTKSYDFAKPAEARYLLGRLLGIGILLAEGEEHKACFPLINNKRREVNRKLTGQ